MKRTEEVFEDVGLDGMEGVDDVDMFGLDSFGSPAGLNPIWGGVIGAGAPPAIGMLLSKFTAPGSTLNKYAPEIGVGASVALAGGMIWMKGTRAAGWTALAVIGTEFLIMQAAKMMMSPTHGMGAYAIEKAYPVAGFGQDVDVELDSGLGIHAIEKGYGVNGFGALPQLVGPPSLVGAGDYGLSQNPAVAQTQILGGPVVSGLGTHWGSTIFGN